MKLKWIIFDVWGVIYKPRDFIKEVFYPFLQGNGLKISGKKVYKEYFKASIGEISSKELWESLGLGKEYPLIEKKYLQEINVLDEDFKRLALSLVNDYHLGIISNDVKEWSFFLLEKYSIHDFFKEIVISGDVKCRKPDKSIFEVFFNRAGCYPSECLFIDDRLENLQTAFALGMKTIRFIREKEMHPFCSEFQVSSFQELQMTIKNFFN
ncbi:MAG: HAD family hydrolase [Promethearchaeota archaeon]